MSSKLIHQLLVIGLHVSEDDKFLSISQDLHFNKVHITLKLIFDAFKSRKFFIKSLNFIEKLFFHLFFLGFKFHFLDFPQLIVKGWFLDFQVSSWFNLYSLLFFFFLWLFLSWSSDFLSLIFIFAFILLSSHTHSSDFFACLCLFFFLENMLFNILFSHFNFCFRNFDLFIDFKLNLIFLKSELLVDLPESFVKRF